MTWLLLLLGCGDDDPCAGRRDLATSPAGLDLTEGEHPSGWGRTECFQCHQAWDIHAEDCVDAVPVAMEPFEVSDPEACVACHGANGVAAWAALVEEE